MRYIQLLGLVVTALVMTAFSGTASATTLETNGVLQTGAVTLDLSLVGSETLSDTSNSFANTCKAGTVSGTTNVFTGAVVSGPISTMTYTSCTHEKVVVHNKGTFSIESIGSTKGILRWNGTEVTFPVTLGSSLITVNCKTSSTTIGTITGTASGSTTVHVNAVLNCGFFLPSAKWVSTWVATGHSIGVSA
jgi:hypothetical protein